MKRVISRRPIDPLKTLKKASGGFSVFLGVGLLVSWVVLLVTRWEVFRLQWPRLIVHTVIEAGVSSFLVVAGLGMLLAWASGPLLLAISNALLLLSIILALVLYGPSGHGALFDGLYITLSVTQTYLLGLAYLWEHFVLGLDERSANGTEKNESAREEQHKRGGGPGGPQRAA
ncbi:MAG TPA: hypothetical protein VL588_02435 [Bdellovibrionota bacterium]|jgi:hypothetical protein|nr:hypothetical protein [Bdellovibrionota bacterium]